MQLINVAIQPPLLNICHVLKTVQPSETQNCKAAVCKQFYLLKLSRTCSGLHNVHHPFRRLCHYPFGIQFPHGTCTKQSALH